MTDTVEYPAGQRRRDAISVLRDVERDEEYHARPLAVVTVEKFVYGVNDTDDLDYGTIRNAMEATDGEICVKLEDSLGYGYLALEDGELVRLMKMEKSDRYNGPFVTTVEQLDGWLSEDEVCFIIRDETPFSLRGATTDG